MTRTEIAHRAKELLISGLRLEITPEEIVDAEPIFGSGLGLDSIDALAGFVENERRRQNLS